MGVSCGQELSTHVQQIVRMGAETVSALEGVPSSPSVRRVYVDEPSQVVRASFNQLSGFTLPSHKQMIGGASTSTNVDKPSQVISASFAQLRGYGGMPPSHRQMIRVSVVSSMTAPVEALARLTCHGISHRNWHVGSAWLVRKTGAVCWTGTLDVVGEFSQRRGSCSGCKALDCF